MKKVVKVNIGNLAFTLNEDAFEILNRYLDDLKRHYNSKPGGEEVVEGIEERIAELFAERAGADNIISAETTSEVIAILGRPDDIDEESKESSTASSAQPSINYIPKRLFRNPDNRVIGGVCGGLAAYFNIDAVIIRLIYVVLTLGFFVITPFHSSLAFMTFLYIVLWIVIPEAKTVEQRCAMYGESPDIHHIHRRVMEDSSKASRSYRRGQSANSGLLSDILGAVGVAIGVILTIVGFSGIIALSVFFLGLEVFDGLFPVNIIDFISLDSIGSIWIKICGLCVLFIPFIGMLMGGIQLVFRLKRSRFRPGLILAIVWWVAFFALLTLGTVSSRGYWEDYTTEQSNPLKFNGDTLYIRYESAKQMPAKRTLFEADLSSSTLFWYDNSSADKGFVVFPQVKLIRQSDEDTLKLKTKVHTFGRTRTEAMMKGEKSLPAYELKDSLLIIHDDFYSKKNKWDGTYKEVRLYIPDKTKVIIQSPVKHGFDDIVRMNKNCEIRWWDDDNHDWDIDIDID